MKGFVLGMTTMFLIDRNLPKIIKKLDEYTAVLVLRADMLIHDNPELGEDK